MQQPYIFFGKICWLGSFHVKNAMKLIRIKNGQDDDRSGSLQNRARHFRDSEIAFHANLSASSYFADNAFSQRQAPPQSAATAASLGLDHHFLARIVEQANAHVVKSKAAFQLLGHSR